MMMMIILAIVIMGCTQIPISTLSHIWVFVRLYGIVFVIIVIIMIIIFYFLSLIFVSLFVLQLSLESHKNVLSDRINNYDLSDCLETRLKLQS